ncbi:MAG TPA: selenocysteine synthase [Candidatus Methylomirabilis sp.]|nr:selenocysteine synthase [Candidatus Methylomirabilis sp.]
MHIYDRLGVRRRINAAGTLTRLGGSLMPPDVLEAMTEAAQWAVDIAELQATASTVIAECTGAEAGLVTSGAAAALTLGAAACLTGLDVARMERLPDTDGMPNEVLMCRSHRTTYDHAIRAAGVRIKEVGFNDRMLGAGVRGVEPWEIEAAVTSQTVAIAYTASASNEPSLPEVVAVGRDHGLPVIVDAAAQLPPVTNLRRFIAEGAALVAFSGGKAIRGPQSTGILCGRRDLIAAAALQLFDMDVAPETWSPPDDLIPRQKLRGVPHHGLGRGFKVGKEEIVGLIVALQRFVKADPIAENAAKERQLAAIAQGLSEVPHVRLRLLPATETGRVPLLELALDESALGRTGWAISLELQQGDLPVHANDRRAAEGILTVNPAALRDGDEHTVAARLREVLMKRT